MIREFLVNMAPTLLEACSQMIERQLQFLNDLELIEVSKKGMIVDVVGEVCFQVNIRWLVGWERRK
jgi:hypothetical protein